MILVRLHFLAKIHTTHSLKEPVSVRLLRVATESPKHTEVVFCNEKVQRVSQLGHSPTCGPQNLNWRKKGCPLFCFFPLSSTGVGEEGVGNRQGNGIHSKIDEKLLAT